MNSKRGFLRSSGEAPRIPATYSKATDVRRGFQYIYLFWLLRVLMYGNMVFFFISVGVIVTPFATFLQLYVEET